MTTWLENINVYFEKNWKFSIQNCLSQSTWWSSFITSRNEYLINNSFLTFRLQKGDKNSGSFINNAVHINVYHRRGQHTVCHNRPFLNKYFINSTYTRVENIRYSLAQNSAFIPVKPVFIKRTKSNENSLRMSQFTKNSENTFYIFF